MDGDAQGASIGILHKDRIGDGLVVVDDGVGGVGVVQPFGG